MLLLLLSRFSRVRPHSAKLNSQVSVFLLLDLFAILDLTVCFLLLESLSSLGFHDTMSPDSLSVSLVAAFLDSVPPHFLNLLKL